MAVLSELSVVDGDGHVLEPATLWTDYIESRHRERALRIEVDADGLEYIVVDEVPFGRLRPGSLSLLGSMGDPDARPGPERRYMDSMPLGACDPTDRLTLLDQQGLDAAVLYTTLGIIWEIATRDVELADAMARAYNRWIADFCRENKSSIGQGSETIRYAMAPRIASVQPI